MDDKFPYEWMYVDNFHVAQLLRSIADMEESLVNNENSMYGILGIKEGGIIAYAFGWENTQTIVKALNVSNKEAME